MAFLVVGLNHRTSTLDVRERLTLSKAQRPEALKALAGYGVPGVILCTCNRSEFYVMEPENGPATGLGYTPGEDRIKQFLADWFRISLSDVDRFLYVHREYQCVQHLFRVASSLDSMILGEEQIIGQVREAFDVARQSDTIPGPLSHLFERALRVGRKVRRDTGVGRNALSVSRACVELARSALGDLKGRKAIVVGAGEAGKLAAKALARSGVREITVANRTYERAADLARGLYGKAVTLPELVDALVSADIVIGCTDSAEYVLNANTVRNAMAARARRPLFLLDIAVPRDFEPAAGSIDNVFLRDVDDLESVSETSRQEREKEARLAEELVASQARQFLEWWRSQEDLPTVVAPRDIAEQIREKELGTTLNRLNGMLTPEEAASAEATSRAITNKLPHGPTVYLKGLPSSTNLAVAKELLGLPEDENQRNSEG